jgi:hypothetical protein
VVIIDDEAGFEFQNGTIEGEDHKTLGPGYRTAGPGLNKHRTEARNGKDDEAPAGGLTELRPGLANTSRWRDSEAATFVLANF